MTSSKFKVQSSKASAATLRAENEALRRKLGWVGSVREARPTEAQDMAVFAQVNDGTPWWRTVLDLLEEQREMDALGVAQQGLSAEDRAYRAGLLARSLALRDTLLELRERASTPTA